MDVRAAIASCALLALHACAPSPIELTIPEGARALVIAAPPDRASVRALDDRALSGALDGEGPLMALFFAADLAALGVAAGPLDGAHPPFPAALGEYTLDAAHERWDPLLARPAWLELLLRPPCPALALDTVATPSTERGVELLDRVDGRRALARIDDRIVTIDADGVITTITTTTARVGDALTDGERLWLLGGRYGLATGRMLEGRIDGAAELVRVAPPGWPAEAGGVRRVDGARVRGGAPDVVVATDQGWLLAFDGERWRVRYRPSAPVRFAAARVAWLARDVTALAPGLIDGPRALEVRGSTVSELVLLEPRLGPEREQVFSLARGARGDVLLGGDRGRVYRAAAGAPRADTLAELGGVIHALAESPREVWTYGPLGLGRIGLTDGRVCAPLEGTAYTGTGRVVVLDDAVIMGGGDVIQRATVRL